MKVNVKSSFLDEKTIKKIEKHYNAKYVLESCLKPKDSGWLNFPAAIFYTEKAHPAGSNYMAIFKEGHDLVIADGITAVKDVIYEGLEAEGEVIYSRYRWDGRSGKNGAFVDGGRDYFRYGGDRFDDYNRVKFKVVEDRLEFIDGEVK